MAIKTCIIDNFDSFTFNLVDLVAEVSQQKPWVIKNNQFTAKQLLKEKYDNIIISPGPGTTSKKNDIGICLDIIANNEKPMLGVCLGHQAIAYHFGGRCDKVITIAPPMHGKASAIFHDGTGIFANLPNPFWAGRYHSLMVVEKNLSPDLKIIAHDKAGHIMGLAHRHKPIFGVQFHPESILTPDGKKIMQNFFNISQTFLTNHKPSTAFHIKPPAKKITSNKKIFCDRWHNAPAMQDIFAKCFLPNTAAIWLDGDSKKGWGYDGFSYIGTSQQNETSHTDGVIKKDSFLSLDDNFFQRLTAAIHPYLVDEKNLTSLPKDLIDKNHPAKFFGGAMGFLGYEGRMLCADAFHKNPLPKNYPNSPFDGFFIIADRLVIENKTNGKIYLIAIDDENKKHDIKKWFAKIKKMANDKTPPTHHPSPHLTWSFAMPKKTYIDNIKSAIAAIKNGDIYQLCLTNQLNAQIPADHASPSPFAIYCHLRHDNNTPYRGFLSWQKTSAILCFSPEIFLEVTQKGNITTKPIKGTIRRGDNQTDDNQLAKTLLASEKNRAENIMIVDLLRNDLTRIAHLGSIKVKKICELESFDRVHQLTSTINADLLANKNIMDILAASFPGGSMTGAPKIRAMEWIHHFENRQRGVYAGVMGYIGHATSLAMVIRTLVMVLEKNHWHYSLGVGGGIVADSNPEEEWQELNWKIAGVMESLKKIINITIKQ